MSRFFWICLGGAVGTGARYILAGWAIALLGTAFPFGTLLINVLGSFGISLVMHLALSAKLIAPTLRLTLTTGLLGGFTTYSTFNYETLAYLREGNWAVAITSVAATVLLCLAAGLAGVAVGRALVGT
ncbi:MAG TPA: fluoride efflux transporter CrcB [Thermoanaerobaculia bacterium]